MTDTALTLPLYDGPAPGSEDWQQAESRDPIWWSQTRIVRNVSQPAIDVYVAPEPNGCGVILCPGGGWHVLAYEDEGVNVARQLNALGITAMVLRYRLVQTGENYVEEFGRNMADPDTREKIIADIEPLIIADGQQAMRLAHQHAGDWGLDPARIGIMGYSAGGNLAVNFTLAEDTDQPPAFLAAVYTAGWRDRPVPEGAPPLFVTCASDDEMAVPNSIRLYNEWRASGASAELHIFTGGGHGFCLRKQGLPCDHWFDRVVEWLDASGFRDPVAP